MKKSKVKFKSTNKVDLKDTQPTTAFFSYMGLSSPTATCAGRDGVIMGTKIYVHDADLDAARSRVATDFMLMRHSDVLVMIDRDIEWSPGDYLYLVQATRHVKGIVGGIYARKKFGEGFASKLPEGVLGKIGDDTLVKLSKPNGVGAGFLGIHKTVVEKMAGTIPRVVGGWFPFFLPRIVELDEEIQGSKYWRMPEDLALCELAHTLDIPVFAALKPMLRHWGEYGFTCLDAMRKQPPGEAPLASGSVASAIENLKKQYK